MAVVAMGLCVAAVVEADGSRMLPIKAPAADEPQIPDVRWRRRVASGRRRMEAVEVAAARQTRQRAAVELEVAAVVRLKRRRAEEAAGGGGGGGPAGGEVCVRSGLHGGGAVAGAAALGASLSESCVCRAAEVPHDVPSEAGGRMAG